MVVVLYLVKVVGDLKKYNGKVSVRVLRSGTVGVCVSYIGKLRPKKVNSITQTSSRNNTNIVMTPCKDKKGIIIRHHVYMVVNRSGVTFL